MRQGKLVTWEPQTRLKQWAHWARAQGPEIFIFVGLQVVVAGANLQN